MSVQRSRGSILDGAFFLAGGLSAAWLAYLTFVEGVRPGWPTLLLVVFWLLAAYLVLPRLHRILTSIYVPDYFIGRTRTADGLLGDPVNLALNGTEGQLHHALQQAGWTRADPLTLRSGRGIVTSTLFRRSYPEAPVSSLFLFRRRQDFAYQQEVEGSPSKRHHVRFWRCPDGWPLPGGTHVDWLAAGTFDRSVGLSLFTFQVTHKIAADVDVERDHIVDTVLTANASAKVAYLRDFFTGYHSRNGGGDAIKTDGDLPVLDLTSAHDPGQRVVEDLRKRRPSPLVFGVAVTYLRALTSLSAASLVLLGLSEGTPQTDIAAQALVLVIVYLLASIVDLVLATATWFGFNVARLLLSSAALVGVLTIFIGRGLTGEHGPLHMSLIPLSLSVLVLLALSSSAARDYTIRGRRASRNAGQAVATQ